MDNTKLIELRRVYENELAAGRYLTAEEVCWRALEICGYRGSRRKFSYWLTPALLKISIAQQQALLWQWACSLADIYYELGRYSDAEPVYAKLAVIWMSLPPDLKGAKTHSIQADLLRKLAGAEAFVGKERRAGRHWKLANQLSGRCKRISSGGFSLRLIDGDKLPVTATILRGPVSGRLFSRWDSIAGHRRFRRNR